jgi:hypothetical protein
MLITDEPFHCASSDRDYATQPLQVSPAKLNMCDKHREYNEMQPCNRITPVQTPLSLLPPWSISSAVPPGSYTPASQDD